MGDNEGMSVARPKKKTISKSIRVGKNRISGRVTKSKVGRSGKPHASAQTPRSARGRRKTKITEVRIGGRIISLEPAPVKTDRKSSKDAKDTFYMSKASMEKNAAQLVDLAAGLLKTGAEFGVQLGVQSGVKGQKVLKDKANSLVTGATRRVNRVVRKGSRLARKGIKKL